MFYSIYLLSLLAALFKLPSRSKKVVLVYAALNVGTLLLSLDNYLGGINNDKKGIDSFDGLVFGPFSLPFLAIMIVSSVVYNTYVLVESNPKK